MIDELFEAVNSAFSLSRPESTEAVGVPESAGGILLERHQGVFDAMIVGVEAVREMVAADPERTARVESITTTANGVLDPAIVQTDVVKQPETVADYTPEVSAKTVTESEVEEPVSGGNVVSSLDERRQRKAQQQMMADARAKAAAVHGRVA